MPKLALLSGIIAMVVIPIVLSRLRDPKRALKRTVLAILVFNVFYLVTVLGYYFHFKIGLSAAKAFPGYFSR